MRRASTGPWRRVDRGDQDIARLFAPLGALSHEVATVAYLDGRRALLGMRHMVGATDWLELPIRDIIRDALALDARKLVMAHNHPSGIAEPSRADLAFTRRLVLCVEALDMRLIDHFVIAGDRMTSLRESGFL
ncbi:JAB domain-containing protein [Sphingomonas gellani]|uniref:JAB domain-containing protein n=1 Tax=Sphingomonas gellani TaxID=1166340 RepID=UPI00147EF8C5|nr:JAB domain-containing protein [Sphingomonas gellani]